MATQITITADGDQAKQEIRSVAGSMDRLQQDGVDAMDRTADAVEELVEELRTARLEAGRTDDAIEKVGGAGSSRASRITALSTGFLAVAKGLELSSQAAEKAMRAINFLADSGSPSAIRLRDSITEVQTALIALADDPSVAALSDKLAALASNAADGISDLPDLYRSAVDSIAESLIAAQEAVGLAAEGSLDTLREMQAEEAKSIENAKKRIAEEKELLKQQEEQKKLAEEKARRDKEIEAEQARAEQEAFEESERLAEEEFRKENERIAELVRSQEEANARILESERAMQIERERMQAEAVERQKRALQGTGAAEGVNRAASDAQAVARRLAQQAADARRNELYAGGEQDEQVLAREAEVARRAAHRAAIQQSRGGRQAFSQEQINQAINENAQAQIQGMQQSGRFSNEALQALGESAAEQRRQSEELKSMQEQLAEIRRFQNSTQQDGTRRRSQRNSSRQ